jgi:hypothetical protein
MVLDFSDGLKIEAECKDTLLFSKTSQKYDELVKSLSDESIIELTKEKTPYRRLLCISLIPFALTGNKFTPESLLALYNMEQSINPIETTGMSLNVRKPSIFHIPVDIVPEEPNTTPTLQGYCYFKPMHKINTHSLTLVKRRLCLSFQEFSAELPISCINEYGSFILKTDKEILPDESMILLFSAFIPLFKTKASPEMFKMVFDRLCDFKQDNPLINLALAI